MNDMNPNHAFAALSELCHSRDDRAALSVIERHVQEMETAILRHVTQDGRVSAYESVEHLCNGKCPDEDMPDVRDPDCLACLAMDFTLAALSAREKGTA